MNHLQPSHNGVTEIIGRDGDLLQVLIWNEADRVIAGESAI